MKDDLDNTIDELREAIRLKPDYLQAHFGLAFVLYNKGDLDGATAEYREVIRLNPDDHQPTPISESCSRKRATWTAPSPNIAKLSASSQPMLRSHDHARVRTLRMGDDPLGSWAETAKLTINGLIGK